MEPFWVECQWAPWTSKKASKGGTWENNATGVEKGKMVYSHERRMCTHVLNRICFQESSKSRSPKTCPKWCNVWQRFCWVCMSMKHKNTYIVFPFWPIIFVVPVLIVFVLLLLGLVFLVLAVAVDVDVPLTLPIHIYIYISVCISLSPPGSDSLSPPGSDSLWHSLSLSLSHSVLSRLSLSLFLFLANRLTLQMHSPSWDVNNKIWAQPRLSAERAVLLQWHPEHVARLQARKGQASNRSRYGGCLVQKWVSTGWVNPHEKHERNQWSSCFGACSTKRRLN